MSIFIYPYHRASGSARVLAESLECRRIRLECSRFISRPQHLVVNWGNGSLPSWVREDTCILNHPTAIINAANKLETFNKLYGGVQTVDFTDSRCEAEEWIEDGYKVYCRTTATGRAGSGIVIATAASELVSAPLYTKSLTPCREYRAHVFKDRVIALAQKRRRNGSDAPSDIKIHDNGWVFAYNSFTEPPDCSRQMVVDTISTLGLDFGAVDFLTKQGQVYILEVNSAPGIEGQTVDRYTQAIRSYYDSM